jgi:predicted DsbA family dithiol-disulfide isomerase
LKQQVGGRVRTEGRGFPLAPTPEHHIQRFGSAARAKAEILKHWAAAAREPGGERINAPLMASRPFPYPASLPVLAAVKAAERQGGMLAHETYFEHAQEAHLIQCRNVADREVLLDLAQDLALDLGRFEADLNSGECDRAVLAEGEAAKGRGIQSTPTVVFDDRWALPGAVPVETYLAVLQDLLAGRDPRETAPTAKEGWTLRRPYPIPPGG